MRKLLAVLRKARKKPTGTGYTSINGRYHVRCACGREDLVTGCLSVLLAKACKSCANRAAQLRGGIVKKVFNGLPLGVAIGQSGSDKIRRLKAIADGVCITCHKSPRSATSQQCEVCRDKRRAGALEKRVRRSAEEKATSQRLAWARMSPEDRTKRAASGWATRRKTEGST